MRILYFLCGFILLASSCDKNNEPVIDKEAPVIEILEPEDNFFYAQGDTVFIKALLTDNTLLRKGSIHVHDEFQPFGQDTVFVHEFNLKVNAVMLDTFWIVNDPLDKNYVIYIDAIDQSENLTDKFHHFYQYHE
jgi:hypothetical protein